MKIIWCMGIFFAGSIMFANLTLLIGHSPTYEAAWWKVVCAFIGAVVFSSLIVTENEN